MSELVRRAWMLIQQSRFDEAEKELRNALAQSPEHPEAMRLLAICLCERKRYADADHFANQAIGLAPDSPDPYFTRSVVNFRRNRFKESFEDVCQAIDLDPEVPLYFAQLAAIHYVKKDWRAMLKAAEEGLSIDPEDDDCTNYRSIALVHLNRKAEATASIESALQRNPEEADTHANMGWTLLHQGKPNEAMKHFQEALRLEPNSQWARLGIVEAMKARNILYRWMLGYFLWCQSLAQRAQWYLILGAYLAYQVLIRVSSANPQLAPWIRPLLIAYVLFAASTWLASPLFNLVLRLNKFGRLALDREQTRVSTWVGLCVMGGLIWLGFYLFTGNLVFAGMAICLGFMIPPLAFYYFCDEGWPRMANQSILIALMSLVTTALVLLLGSLWTTGQQSLILENLGAYFALGAIIGGAAASFIVQVLASATPQRQ